MVGHPAVFLSKATRPFALARSADYARKTSAKVSQTRRRGRNLDAGGFHGRNLGFRVALAAGDDGPGMAHAPARRRGAAGNKSRPWASCVRAWPHR